MISILPCGCDGRLTSGADISIPLLAGPCPCPCPGSTEGEDPTTSGIQNVGTSIKGEKQGRHKEKRLEYKMVALRKPELEFVVECSNRSVTVKLASLLQCGVR